jgi:hypothetical protein
VTLAVLRPDSWNFPLFLHVLGATVLFGSMLVASVLAIATWRQSAHPQLLARYAARTMLFLAVPAWLLTRLPAQWILSREKDQIPGLEDKGWVGVGFIVTDLGLVLLIILGVLAFLSARRGGTGRTTATFALLAPVYLLALAVAWFAMSAKPGN